MRFGGRIAARDGAIRCKQLIDGLLDEAIVGSVCRVVPHCIHAVKQHGQLIALRWVCSPRSAIRPSCDGCVCCALRPWQLLRPRRWQISTPAHSGQHDECAIPENFFDFDPAEVDSGHPSDHSGWFLKIPLRYASSMYQNRCFHVSTFTHWRPAMRDARFCKENEPLYYGLSSSLRMMHAYKRCGGRRCNFRFLCRGHWLE